MKKHLLFLLSLTCCIYLSAQEKMYIHKTDKSTLGMLISDVDSVYFSNDASTIYFNIGTTVSDYMVSTIDSITFGDNSNTIAIEYNGNTASVLNPLAYEGVSVAVNGADVTVTSTIDIKDIQYKLSGTTSEGSFKIYSVRGINLILNGVSITNTDGPAINIQGKKTANVILADGTANILTDGATYAPATITGGLAEDQKATFFSEAQLLFSGSGNLTINGRGSEQHALCSDNLIQIENGTINIASSMKDGIHSKDGYIMNGGTVTVTANSDGIDGDIGYISITGGTTIINCASANTNGISCDSILTVSGGTINITTSGIQSKGLKSTQAMTLSGGTITINASGGVALPASGSGVDPSYCDAIKCDADVTVSGSAITITHTGISGKGISTNTFYMTSGTLNIATSGAGAIYTNSLGSMDAYSAACISTDGALSILGGTVNASSTGIGGKGISAGGILNIGSLNSAPTIYVGTSGNAILSGVNSITEPKAIKSDTTIYLKNGNVSVNAAGAGEAIDTKGSIYMSGGTVVAQGPPTNSNTKCIDYATTFNITGGILIECGPYRSKISVPSSTLSTQNYIYATLLSTLKTLPASTFFNIQDDSGNNLVTFKPIRDSYFFIISTPNIQKAKSYNIYTGGASTGTNINGFYTDGIYSGGTKKKNFTTLSTIRTIVTFDL